MSHFEELLQCPYNRSHRILPHAMQRHLFKCRKNNHSTKLVCCPFNTIHRVPGPELKLHIDNCDDRATFELYKYCISSYASNNSKDYKDEEPELIYHHAIPTEGTGKTLLEEDECWDNSNVPTYNPQQYCKTAKVIRKATLMKPSDKQKFHHEEQRRHKQLENVSEKNNNNMNYDKPSFMGYRGSVPESKYYNGEPLKAPGKTLQDDDESTLMKPSQKKEFYYQENQRLRDLDSNSHPVKNDVDEISAKFTRNMNIKCK
ncbi:gametocyte-specific factor 1 homolog [Ochlerotatus camptorhynchus]|uniref:gametocyte-specific factor 1 homolog n=1 Tax=Ochlerotatus camptorhynchus TaxID=644619 RepID=UPI0031DBF37A